MQVWNSLINFLQIKHKNSAFMLENSVFMTYVK
jgi:hypothetical protein